MHSAFPEEPTRRYDATLATTRARPDVRVIAFLCVVCPLFCAHFALSYLYNARPLVFDLDPYVAGTGELPFQFRALAAWAARGVLALIQGAGLSGRIVDRDFFPGDVPLSILVVTFGSMLLTSWFAYLTAAALWRNRAVAMLASAAILYMAYFDYTLPLRRQLLYPYDVPTLCVFTIGLYCIVTGRDRWYVAVFALAALSKETALLLTAFYVVVHWNRGLRALAPAVLLQVLLWGAAKGGLFLLYGGNPVVPPNGGEPGVGGLYIWQFTRNVSYLLTPATWPSLFSVFAFLWVVPVFAWRMLRPVTRGLLLLFLPYAAAMMMVGMIVEIRIFGEFAPVVALAIGEVLHRLWPAPAWSE